ncbi:MAG TPA: hypothetical protein VEQ41_10055 [Solirubrobacterales bacterium]|nr:hypothetical protein [Solirubrobacterales bacterium]
MSKETDKAREDPWRIDEEVRRRRLLEDARRPMSVNLAETIALSEFVSRFAGSAWQAKPPGES